MTNEPQLIITGASGQLARRAAEFAIDKCGPERLILVSRQPDQLSAFAARGAELRRGDFADPASLRTAFAGGGRMLLVSIDQLDARDQLHVAAIEAAVSAGVDHIIYTSCLEPAPPNPAVIAPSHFATEEALKAAPVSWTVLRNSLYSEFQAPEMEQAVRTGKLIHNRGAGKVAYVSRDDCAEAAACVLSDSGHQDATYEITGPEAYAAADLVRIYRQLTGSPIEEQAVDDTSFVAGMIGEAADDEHMKYGARLVASFGQAIREGYLANCTDTIAELSGRRPRSLTEVLKSNLST